MSRGASNLAPAAVRVEFPGTESALIRVPDNWTSTFAGTALAPVVIRLSINDAAAVNCIATGVRGRNIDVSLLQADADRLVADGNFEPGARASIVFHSDVHGDSPKISGIVRAARRSGTGATMSIEIEDWDLLARFWREIETGWGPVRQ